MKDSLRTKLAFSMVKNINTEVAGKILARTGGEDAFFSMSSSELASITGIAPQILSEQKRSSYMERAVNEEKFIYSNNISTAYFTDGGYPSRLLNCNDAPVMLYRLGEADLEARHVIAIVGTRHATPYGIEMTNRIVRELAEKLDDLVIVSGLAYGIDVAAHRAALDNDVPTVAVSAHPLNTIYPADHRGVAVSILRKGGALVTEYSTSHEVHKANFLARNRIIAGLSDLTIVVESDVRGGSLVTAGLAAAYNREVFAVPGRISDKYSQGTNALIASNRAHIFLNSRDLIDEMGWETTESETDSPRLPLEMTQNEQKIHSFLQNHPASSVNDIMVATNIPAVTLKDLLFTMEMKDLVMSMAGSRYSAL